MEGTRRAAAANARPAKAHNEKRLATFAASLWIPWCRGTELNCRHGDFQSPALPTELPKQNIGDPEGARTLDLQRDRLAY